MSCLHPYELINKFKKPLAYNYYTGLPDSQFVRVKCGHCLACLIEKQSQLTFLCNRELLSLYQKNLTASFITLTYSESNLPKNSMNYITLSKDEIIRFHKRLRINLKRAGISLTYKYVICGEYGDGSHANNKYDSCNPSGTTHRPHYHLALFGLSPDQIKPFIMKSWQNKGIIDFGHLTQGGLRYIIGYLSKQQQTKEIKNIYKIKDIQPPFLLHSIGIGKEWILNNMQKIIDDEFQFNLLGKKHLYPNYIINFVCNHYGLDKRKYIKNYYLQEKKPSQTVADYLDFTQAQNEIRYIQKIFALQSKNKAISEENLNHAYLRPRTHTFYPKGSINKLNCLVKEALDD